MPEVLGGWGEPFSFQPVLFEFPSTVTGLAFVMIVFLKNVMSFLLKITCAEKNIEGYQHVRVIVSGWENYWSLSDPFSSSKHLAKHLVQGWRMIKEY